MKLKKLKNNLWKIKINDLEFIREWQEIPALLEALEGCL